MTGVHLLKKAAQQKRLGHAYIVAGSDPALVESFVFEIVQIVHCEKGKACGVCAPCVAAARQAGHPDMIFIRAGSAQGEISIAQVRKLSEALHVRSWSASGKTVVIHEADRMNKEAQSALLAALEEPRGQVVFFLLTQFPELLLETVRSRAQTIPMYHFGANAKQIQSLSWYKAFAKAPLTKKFAVAKKLADTPEKISTFLRDLLSFERSRLLEAVMIHNDRATRVRRQALEAILEAQELVRFPGVNKRLVLERMCVRISH